jgi:hypothetical protein
MTDLSFARELRPKQIHRIGPSWHDVACYHKKPFVCEDSDALMRKARQLSPSVPIP